MALSDKRILEEMEKGNVVIDEFSRDNLATSSYDVTLGDWFYREQLHSKYHHKIFNIFSEAHTKYVWGDKPIAAEPAHEVFKKFKFEWDGIKPKDRIIYLDPGETILAHTNEFIGGRNTVTTMLKARSSLGRVFISVCKCAGWGDVGYINRWTLEITNNSQHYSIPLRVGMRIAQLVFFETGLILGRDYARTGKYQTGQNIEQIKKTWKPEMMLPRLYNDRELVKKK